jgi:hypothetical protein
MRLCCGWKLPCGLMSYSNVYAAASVPRFRKNMLPPSSEYKLRRMFFWNAGTCLPDYTVLWPIIFVPSSRDCVKAVKCNLSIFPCNMCAVCGYMHKIFHIFTSSLILNIKPKSRRMFQELSCWFEFVRDHPKRSFIFHISYTATCDTWSYYLEIVP